MVGFKFENFVRLQGLSNEAYNGKLARVISLSADKITGEFRVSLQVDDGVAVASHLSRQILVKTENMTRACDNCLHAGAATMQYCGSILQRRVPTKRLEAAQSRLQQHEFSTATRQKSPPSRSLSGQLIRS